MNLILGMKGGKGTPFVTRKLYPAYPQLELKEYCHNLNYSSLLKMKKKNYLYLSKYITTHIQESSIVKKYKQIIRDKQVARI